MPCPPSGSRNENPGAKPGLSCGDPAAVYALIVFLAPARSPNPAQGFRSWRDRTPLLRSSASALQVQSSEEPQYEEYNQDQAKSPAEARTTVTTVPVITTASEQQNEQDDNQDYSHVDTLLKLPGTKAPTH